MNQPTALCIDRASLMDMKSAHDGNECASDTLGERARRQFIPASVVNELLQRGAAAIKSHP